MAKRFSDSGKWRKSFLMGLKPEYKLLWLYLIDECDHAGVWDCNFALAEFTLGMKFDPEQALKVFDGRVVEIDNGEKWWIRSFIEFQYGKLNPQNKLHSSVIKILVTYRLQDCVEISNIENLPQKIKPLPSPLQGAKDKDKDKDKEGGVGETTSPSPVPYPVVDHVVKSEPVGSMSVFEIKQAYVVDQMQVHALFKLLQAQGVELDRNPSVLENWIDVFFTKLESQLEPIPTDYRAFCRHFGNWMKYNYRNPKRRSAQATDEPLPPYLQKHDEKKRNEGR